MAVVSEDHADPSLCADDLDLASQRSSPSTATARLISAEEVELHGQGAAEFWCVVDGFVVDATQFVDSHPGGLRKLMSTDKAEAGATGKPFGFSFSRGRNAHFPDTGKRFRNGVKKYLDGGVPGETHLPPAAVAFPPHGQVVILGRLSS